MKTRLLSMFLIATMWLLGANVFAQDLQKDESGAYLISSKADLQTWTKIAGYEKTNIKLTADIPDLNFRMATASDFTGTLDGAGHTITVNYDFPGEASAMFVKFKGTVKNLIVDGYINATYKNSAVLGGTGYGTFENVVVLATINANYGNNASNGAFMGYVNGGTNITNCVSAIKYTGIDAYNMGFCGWVNSAGSVNARNCISIMETELPSAFCFCNPQNKAATTNCFAYEQDGDNGNAPGGTTYINSSILATGELCYLLNKGANSTVFYQTLGEDGYPVPFSTHKEVYGIGNKRCDGTVIDGELIYSNEDTSPTPQHNDVDGWCSVCGNLLRDHITPDADDFLPLASVADLKWFTAMVNDEHETTINGKLTADIDFGGTVNAHTPIGPNTTYKYNGIFDGQGHRIKNMILDMPQNGVGFFGYVRGGSIIRNLIIDKSCEVSGNGQVAGLIGGVQTNAGSPLTVENCVNEATVIGTASAAGIIGAGSSGYPSIKIVNCLNTGEITGTPATAFCSWINQGGSSMSNCVNTGIINGMDNAGNKYDYICNLIRYEPGTLALTNCYDISGMEEIGQGIYEEWTTDNPVEGGELCYLLNGDQSVISWYQKIGTDATPFPSAYFIEGSQVYAAGELLCDGTPLGTVTFSNTTTILPPHEFEDGFCVNCDAPQLDYAEVVDGFHCIDTDSKLYWLSRMVNERNYGNWDVRLTADIDMENYSDLFMPIGSNGVRYTGHFDGQGHKISNLHIGGGNYTGFIGQPGNGAVIENLLLDETCSISATGECAALVGGTNQMSGSVTLRNLGNMGNVYATSKQAAGIFGGNSGSKTSLTIENCFSTGIIEGSTECAALVGWAGSNSPVISNCWSCADVTGNDRTDMWLVRHGNGVFKNIYATQGEQGVIIEDSEMIESGELCYKLNGDQTTISWFQNLDNGAEADATPVPFANGHDTVYPKGKMLCDGTVDPSSVTYSNSKDAVIPDHEFSHGFCTVCGQEDPDFDGFIKGIKNPDFNVDNFGWEGTAPNVTSGLAEHTNKTFNTYQRIAGLQPGVYRLRVQGYSRAAALTNEDIYGDPVNFNDLERNSYVYAETAGLRTSVRLKDITADAMDYKLNDGQGEAQLTDETYVPSAVAGTAKYFSKGKYWNYLYIAVTADTLTIGFSNQVQNNNCYTAIDRLRLEYIGDDAEAYTLIAQQIADDEQELSSLESQASLIEEYENIMEGAENLTDKDEILATADKAARLPDMIKLCVPAYQTYYATVEEIMEYWEKNNDKMQGDEADRLESYLTEEEGVSERFPNGTYLYIKENRQLGIEELQAEAQFARTLLAEAVTANPTEGMDVTSIIVNPKFNEGDWKGWTVQLDDSQNGNIVDNSGFTDVFPVAAGYNSTFEVAQLITGIPNGIYELRANAYHRPGAGHEGLYDGTDAIPAKLFLNNYATPIMSVYADPIEEMNAINGVNCRYDSTTDPEAPHNGEETGSKDILIDGIGYIPDNTYTASFAFNGDRYKQSAYAVVTDGTLRLGVRNEATPWHSKNHTVWGNFQLIYQGNSQQTIADMMEQYETRLDLLEIQRDEQERYMSQSHTDNIRKYIGQIRVSNNIDKQLELISLINDEFNAIEPSIELYKQLADLNQYAIDMANGLEEGKLQEYMIALYDELSTNLVTGDLTDEQVTEKINSLMQDPQFGGVIYVQGDLYDENSENGEWDYSRMCTLYPLYQNAEGKWVGSVTLQDRSRRIQGYQRAGFYFRRINTIYKCNEANRNFVTPANHIFGVQEGGTDLQALNGTYNIVLDVENGIVDCQLQDKYNWDNQVYVTGTLTNRSGTTDRWKNNEHWPLQHVGNGKYVGTVDMVLDNANSFCSFGIMACRSTEDMVNYSTTARSSWTEARYGSSEQYLMLESGQKVDSLVRGLDRTWRISPAGKYLIEFDMDKVTMKATLLQTKGRGTETDPYQIATTADLQSMPDRLVNGQTTYFKLMDDIEMYGKGWWPLNANFFGNSFSEGYGKRVSLDGNNHIIKNVTIAANEDNTDETGFFGALVGSVQNLGLWNIKVDGSNTASVGGLAGRTGDAEAEDAPLTTISGVYVSGTVEAAEGTAGALIGSVMSNTTITNVYANANVCGEGYLGDFIGAGNSGLTIINSYSAGKANGSQATIAIADEQGYSTQNFLYYGIQNQEEICNVANKWEGWNSNGTIGNGWPILNWQVERGDYTTFCGYVSDEEDGLEKINNSQFIIHNNGEAVYDLSGRKVQKPQKGLYIQNGRKILVK
ncbi:MAG: hypothetical protein J6W52_02725 [Bacteroidaceae bacterium]|nr:hypothetical protein [Bacteroidaceae bacterium]